MRHLPRIALLVAFANSAVAAETALHTKLIAPAHTFRAGYPIRMKLLMTNTGEATAHFHEPQVSINGRIIVRDEHGQSVPYIGGSAQTVNPLVDIWPGETKVLDDFDLTACYYLRKPGHYTALFAGAEAWGPMGVDAGEDAEPADSSIPASDVFTFEVRDSPAGTADGDPVGRLLPLAQGAWALATAGRSRHDIQPGNTMAPGPGWPMTFEHNPTGIIADVALVHVWLMDQRSVPVEPDWRENPVGPSEYIGRIGRWHVYIAAQIEALKRWPTVNTDVRNALSHPPGHPGVRPSKQLVLAPDEILPANVDRQRSLRARVVLRVERVSPGEGSKYHWPAVRVLRELKNTTYQPFPNKLRVAHYGGDPGIPSGECTIYLEDYGNGTNWRLLDGRAETGVSHVADKP